MDYFGARYYDSRLGFWLSVDPLADKYPNVTPYLYCNGNPVMLVDPDGRDWYQNEDTQYYHWFDGAQEHEGYKYIGGKGALLGNEKLENVVDNNLKSMSGGVGLYSGVFTFDIAPSDKGALSWSKERDWDFVDEFAYNVGPVVSFLMEDHPYTQKMMNDPMILSYQAAIADNQTQVPGCYTNVKRNWNILSVLNPANFNMAAQFIGSFRYDGFSDNGCLYNVISDSKNVRSLLYHLPFTEKLNGNRNVNSQGFGNTYQFYIWKK